MSDSSAFSGIALPSPTLSARLGEVAAHLAAPLTDRLTEEQRALTLGIARRLVGEAAAALGAGIDPAALWHDWLVQGLPGAERLAAPCFARAEEHRWRALPVPHRDTSSPADGAGDEGAVDMPPAAPQAPLAPVDKAYLDLTIADRRRFDALGNPCIAVADLDPEIYRALLGDVVEWQAHAGVDTNAVAELDDAACAAAARQTPESGIDAAAAAYHAALVADGALSDAAAAAAMRHDWPALIGLAAAAHRRPYGEMALALVSAEAAALPPLLAPLRIDRGAIAPIEASLARVPARALAGAPEGEG